MEISTMINQLNSVAWAIRPEKLESISGIIERGAREGFEAQASRQYTGLSYMNVDDTGIATIHIHGMVGRRQSILEYLFGGILTEVLLSDMNKATADPKVKGILLHIDSPGGLVDGTKELADAIYGARTRKPVFAIAEGQMCSAAYWIGSSANKVFAEKTALIGSIGVVSTHYDFSGYDEKVGVKRTYIYNGKYKRIANDAEPLSKEGRAYLQEIVDDFYSIFVNDVSRNRSPLTQANIKGMESKLYIADKALTAGLIDGIATSSEVYKSLSAEIDKPARQVMSKSKPIPSVQAHPIPKVRTFEELVGKYQVRHKISRGKAISQVVKDHPKAHEDYLKKFNLEERCKIEWKCDPDLRAEYRTIEAYLAYKKAEADGRIQTRKRKVNTLQSETKQTKNFEILVAEYMERTGHKRSTAISYIVEKYAEEHQDFLNRCNKITQYQQEFRRDPDLQREFGSMETYVAFKEAEAKGLVKIARSKVITV